VILRPENALCKPDSRKPLKLDFARFTMKGKLIRRRCHSTSRPSETDVLAAACAPLAQQIAQALAVQQRRVREQRITIDAL
jgi:hypothetical protein